MATARSVGFAWLVVAVAVLVGTQMVMTIFSKMATQAAPLPLLLCVVQFVTSAMLACVVSIAKGNGVPVMPRSLLTVVATLSAVWTAGFVLFNASATVMSPSIVNLVRCVEPLASVTFGLMTGERYSLGVIVTLVPICGGVLLASFKGGMEGLPPLTGVTLAMLSNMCFCLRAVFKHKVNKHPDKNAVDAIGLFFNICCVAIALLPPFVFLFEGDVLEAELRQLQADGTLWAFVSQVLASSVFFFLYQFSQLNVMSALTPLEFSILTPIIKAFVIMFCAVWFGDDFGLQSAVGVVVSLGGGYAFSLARNQVHKGDTGKTT
mmetsp:Transcript_30922/g.92859  ORF Transcript_30922/g.92859 Transcript_30922/m.92859 type:complete len:320 (-) Transcript_30922:124-1083(-)